MIPKLLEYGKSLLKKLLLVAFLATIIYYAINYSETKKIDEYTYRKALVGKYINHFNQKAKVTDKHLDNKNLKIVVILLPNGNEQIISTDSAILGLYPDQLPLVNPDTLEIIPIKL